MAKIENGSTEALPWAAQGARTCLSARLRASGFGGQECPRAGAQPATCNPQPATRILRVCRQLGWAWWLGAGLTVLGGAVLYGFEPGRYGIYPVCLFHQTTGLLCPGCGSLRALHQLLHGHLAAAFHLNPLLVVSLPPGLWFGAAVVRRKARGQPVSFAVRPLWVWLFLAVTLVFSVCRNLPGFR